MNVGLAVSGGCAACAGPVLPASDRPGTDAGLVPPGVAEGQAEPDGLGGPADPEGLTRGLDAAALLGTS